MAVSGQVAAEASAFLVDRRSALTAMGAAVAGPSVPAPLPETTRRTTADRPMMYASDFRVVGDGVADDTVAAQSFLDACVAAGARVAHFGAMIVRITGPLRARGVGLVFDADGYGGKGRPGIHATGQGYTALTVTGVILDFCATVYGAGAARHGPDGAVVSDTRPRLNGIAFGEPGGGDPLAASVIRHARAFKLAGVGISHDRCWDTSFIALSVEDCGTADAYAFEVNGSRAETCNECVWMRVQVETAACKAIRVDANTLSSSFLKIHGERATGIASTYTWLLGGACQYAAVRLTAANPTIATAALVGGQMDVADLRAEDGLRVFVDASGGTINFHNPSAALVSAKDQSGRVNVIGGDITVMALGGGWTLIGATVRRLEAGFMSPGAHSSVLNCAIAELVPQTGATQGDLLLNGCTVSAGAAATDAGRLRRLRLLAGTDFAGAGGRLMCRDQVVEVDATSTVRADVRVERGALLLDGTITGSLSMNGQSGSTAGATATVTGPVRGWGPPTGPVPDGAACRNLAPTVEVSGGRRSFVEGWRRVGGAWRSLRVDIDGRAD